jgi:Lrp/AsnC family transcriptional regulator, leucine-responsive regulatory protein
MNKLGLYDKKILYQLDNNSRQSVSQIGKKVGLHKNSTNYRIKNLEENDIINGYYAVIDSFKLGYEVLKFYITFQYTTSTIENEIFNYFKKSDLIWALYTINGRFDLDLILWINDRDKFYEFWEKTLYNYSDYFQNIKLSFYIRLITFNYEYLLSDKNLSLPRERSILTGQKGLYKISDLDYKILKIIAPNARISLTDLANQLNKPRSLIKSHFYSLLKKGIIQGFRVNLNTTKIGYEFFKVDIQLKNYKKRKSIIDYSKKNPHLIGIDETVGISHIEFEYHLKSIDDIHQIISDLTSKFPESIRSYQYFSINKRLKLSYFS